jgi:hypothetical protein
MRQPSLWRSPYRLNLVPEGARTRQDFGPELTCEICLGISGPLSETGAGALTRWLGVPWQTDGASCGSGGDYTPEHYLSIPSFWGARVPNDVLPQAAFQRLSDMKLSPLQRAKHFSARKRWYRLIDVSDGKTRPQAMIEQWWRLGLVEPLKAPEKLGFGDLLHVEIPKDEDQLKDDPTLALIECVEELGVESWALNVEHRTISPSHPRLQKVFKRPRIHYGRGDI